MVPVGAVHLWSFEVVQTLNFGPLPIVKDSSTIDSISVLAYHRRLSQGV